MAQILSDYIVEHSPLKRPSQTVNALTLEIPKSRFARHSPRTMIAANDGYAVGKADSGELRKSDFRTLSAAELILWLQQHAPEKYFKERLVKVCKMAKEMEVLGGTNEGSVGKTSLVDAREKFFPWKEESNRVSCLLSSSSKSDTAAAAM
jgi:hypothetical protein